ncbi:hypothetical protein [Burkholderia gladioli]|uniref:hypothetical protein n=1 Tax=Burkholderia gladioli TaxID=28095 RepID=UPI0013F68A9C|nr:hypothetical protein [Burkholderia gladioli]NHH78052.1 hypothetical protein [Burkholderia gladioli]
MSIVISFPKIQNQAVSYVAGGLTFVILLAESAGSQENGESIPSALYKLQLPNGGVVYSTAEGIRGLIEEIVAGQIADDQAAADQFLRGKKARWSLRSKMTPGKSKHVWVCD